MLQLNSDNVVVKGAVGLLAASLLYYLFRLRKATVLDVPIEGIWKSGQGRDWAAVNTLDNLKTYYWTHYDRFFKVREPYGDLLIVPIRYIEELKALPQNILSFEKAVSVRMLGQYTHLSPHAFGNHGRAFPTSIGQNLTRNLSSLMKVIHDECNFAFKTHIDSCDDWTEVKIFDQIVLIVALISGRVFIGPEMNRDPEYLRCIIRYTQEVFFAVGAMQSIHPWLRGLYTYLGWVPEIKKVNESHASMRRMLGPIITQRLEAMAAGEDLPPDMVSWNLTNSPADIRGSVKVQAHNQLQASMMAILTTSLTGSHAIFDVASNPGYQKQLQDELASVMAQDKVPYLSKTSTPKLRLLDSFLKESQRLNPIGQITFNRRVERDITLHDGVILPAGTMIAVSYAQRYLDSNVYENPTTFDPWRFHKMREEKGHESRYQFVTTGPDSLSFGYGNHACPGRFFANNELKIILAYILTHYDIKMPEGQGRPGNIATAAGSRPDTSKTILMRRRVDI